MEVKFSWWLLFSVACLARLCVCYDVSQSFRVSRGKSFMNTCSSWFLSIVVTTEAACAFQCLVIGANSSTGGVGCYAAQYRSNSKTCTFMTTGKFVALVADSTAVTYINDLVASQNFYPQADVFLPLSSSCTQNFTDNNGFLPLDNVSKFGTFLPLNWAMSAIINNPLTWAYPTTVNNYVLATASQSPYSLNIFGGSFTISLYLYAPIYGSVWPQDQPVLEFLGATTGQICYALRVGCSASCIEFHQPPMCNTAAKTIPSFTQQISRGYSLHYTLVYNSFANLLTQYINGTFSSVVSNFQFTPPAVTITRLNVGGSDKNGWYGFSNGFLGLISCVQLYSKALDENAVSKAAGRCFDGVTTVMI